MNLQKLRQEIWFETTRSSGAGGQHINRTNSAAILIWKPRDSGCFSEDELSRICKGLEPWMNHSGYVRIRSQSFREQTHNKKAAFRRLVELIKKSLQVPPKRIKTKPSKTSQRKRVESKRKKGELKALRSRPKIWQD
ncbi:MAG: alternative ribosome rescue aminoacyl-tRNA hydrolase ArfB [Bdellovibrionaceae bacterium]|nr:alternative ribosome rescue aminoacyl-tRNA hydrolase ArfB [Pseudobdellovibrionaceae bacterium]